MVCAARRCFTFIGLRAQWHVSRGTTIANATTFSCNSNRQQANGGWITPAPGTEPVYLCWLLRVASSSAIFMVAYTAHQYTRQYSKFPKRPIVKKYDIE